LVVAASSEQGQLCLIHADGTAQWRITSLLGVDLADPDQRLALQLACRARLLH